MIDRYFPHDQNARHDPKIKAIQSLFELGYSYYFKTVEYLYDQKGELEINRFFIPNLKGEIGGRSDDEVESFIAQATSDEIPLFYITTRKGKKYLRSKSLDKRLDVIDKKSETARQSARARWEKKPDTATAGKSNNKFADDSIEIKISKRIFHEFAERHGAREPNFQTWARDVDLILRRDKFEIDFVEKTLDAIAEHEGSNGFRWGDVIRCPSKLRKHLKSGMVSPKLNSKRPSGGVEAKRGKYDKVGVDV